MTRTKKPEKTLIAADGREIHRRFSTYYWFDGRLKAPSPWSRGYPRFEVGSIEGAAREVMTGRAYKVQCVDRVRGRIMWTVTRGERVAGTHLHDPIISRGDADYIKPKP